MQINIISRSINRSDGYGAWKVGQNTAKGLINLGVDVKINGRPEENAYNWIHDDARALFNLSYLGKPAVIGPNITVLPSQLPGFRPNLCPESVMLFPSDWIKVAWKRMGFQECNTKIWAAGVDLDKFAYQRLGESGKTLVYVKYRERALVERVTRQLEKIGRLPVILEYGGYTEADYIRALRECDYGIWISGTESQGFALLEALSSALPILVLSIVHLRDNKYSIDQLYIPKFPEAFLSVTASSAPYFDDRCGRILSNYDFLENEIDDFEADYRSFSPLSYVLENFSLEKKAGELVSILRDLPRETFRKYIGYSGPLAVLYFASLASSAWTWRYLVGRIIRSIQKVFR